jgi:hypothetical protein
MKDTSRRIFRASAVQRYQQSRQMATLPKFIPGWIFVCAWTILLLLLVLGVAIWLAEFPNYLAAPAYYLAVGPGDDFTLGLVLTPQQARQIQQGQKLLLTSPNSGQTLVFTIIEIDLQPRATNQIRDQFSMSPNGVSLPPMLHVVRVRATIPATPPPKTAAYNAQVQIGSSRLVSFFSSPG